MFFGCGHCADLSADLLTAKVSQTDALPGPLVWPLALMPQDNPSKPPSPVLHTHLSRAILGVCDASTMSFTMPQPDRPSP